MKQNMNRDNVTATIGIIFFISIAIGLTTLFISVAFILAPVVAIGFGVYLVHMFVVENNKPRKKRKK